MRRDEGGGRGALGWWPLQVACRAAAFLASTAPEEHVLVGRRRFWTSLSQGSIMLTDPESAHDEVPLISKTVWKSRGRLCQAGRLRAGKQHPPQAFRTRFTLGQLLASCSPSLGQGRPVSCGLLGSLSSSSFFPLVPPLLSVALEDPELPPSR